MNKELCFDGLFSNLIVNLTHKKKKKIWSIETAYISAEGETEKEACLNLAKELRLLAEELESHETDQIGER